MAFTFYTEIITANITLYAKWVAVTDATTYTVNLDVDSGSHVRAI